MEKSHPHGTGLFPPNAEQYHKETEDTSIISFKVYSLPLQPKYIDTVHPALLPFVLRACLLRSTR